MDDVIKHRKYYFDLLKLLAIWLVIFNHTGRRGFLLFTVSQQSGLFGVYLFLSVLDKIAVPLFWMVSGALLLGKEETISVVLRKRVLRFTMVLVLFSGLQYIYIGIRKSQEMSLGDFFTSIFQKEIVVSYWYLYAYLAYLIMLPFLRKIAKQLNGKEMLYLLVAYLLFGGLIPMMQYLIWNGEATINPQFQVTFLVSSNIFYPLLGYYIDKELPKAFWNRKNQFICLGLGMIAIIVTCVMTVYVGTTTGNWRSANIQQFYNALICLPVLSVFFGVEYFGRNHPISEKSSHCFQILGAATFSVYLIENLIRKNSGEIYEFLCSYLGKLTACIVWVTVIFLIAMGIGLILKRIPGLKKLL